MVPFGVLGHDVLDAKGGSPLLFQLLSLPLLEQVKEGDDLEQFPLVAEIGKEVDLDEDVQLTGVQTAVMGKGPQQIGKGGVLPLGEGIELIHHGLPMYFTEESPLAMTRFSLVKK